MITMITITTVSRVAGIEEFFSLGFCERLITVELEEEVVENDVVWVTTELVVIVSSVFVDAVEEEGLVAIVIVDDVV